MTAVTNVSRNHEPRYSRNLRTALSDTLRSCPTPTRTVRLWKKQRQSWLRRSNLSSGLAGNSRNRSGDTPLSRPPHYNPCAAKYSSIASTTTAFRLWSFSRARVLARRWVGRRQTDYEPAGERFLWLLAVFSTALKVEIYRLAESLLDFINRLATEVHMIAVQVDDSAIELVTVYINFPQIPLVAHHGLTPIVLSIFSSGPCR